MEGKGKIIDRLLQEKHSHKKLKSTLLLASVLLVSTGAAVIPWLGIGGPWFSAQAQQQIKKVALVIGNKDYTNLGRLKNPINDARGMAASLEKRGFEVMLKENIQDVNQFLSVTREFSSRLSPGSVALIYYAGHAVQVKEINYLIPTAVNIQDEKDIPYNALNLNDLIESLNEGKSQTNILILDACRDNPFVKSSRNLARGLAIVEKQPENFLIAYASAPGGPSSDGEGENGLYTQELLKAIETPGLSIEEVFKQVRRNVRLLSKGNQLPEVRSLLEEPFYFYPLNKPTPPPIPVLLPTPQRPEQNLLQTVTNSLGMEFKLIPAGSFMMGSPNSESGRNDDEKTHHVTLTQSYYMQTTEVTQGQWQSVMRNNPSYFKGSNVKESRSMPVETVSWNDVQEFISRMNSRGEGQYRLPTEAEWEYAARSGSSGPYACEGNCLSELGWYDGNSGNKTHPVGLKQPNGWGLYDMYGNVWEWVSDWYGYYPDNAVKDPTGAETGYFRVFRGGSWFSYAQFSRSAIRFRYSPDIRDRILGFRLVRTP